MATNNPKVTPTAKFAAASTAAPGRLGIVSIDPGTGDSFSPAPPVIPFNEIVGTDGDNALTGTEANDNILGIAGNDTIIGGAGDDNIDGGTGDDNIGGGAGDDNITEITGKNIIQGGAGIDNLFLTATDAGVTLTYTDINNGSTSTGDAITGIENIIFGGGKGNDTVNATAASTLSASGNDGNDTLIGGSGADSLSGDGGDDLLEGGDGDDFLSETTGNNVIRGGAGNDFLSLGATDAGVTLTYTDANNGSTSTGDIITGIENISFGGGAGNDVVNATAASTLSASGGGGNDIFTGTNGDDFLDGGEGDDTLDGGAGDDYFTETVGTNTIIGGEGNDTLSLFPAGTTAVTVTYTDVNNGTTSIGDKFSGIENLSLFGGKGTNDIFIATAATTASLNGGDGDDSLTGSNGNDYIYGNIGNDTINGGSGDDYISGGDDFEPGVPNLAEVDLLTGGAGKDTFLLSSGGNQLYAVGGNSDYAKITDFNLSDDTIQLSGTASEYSIQTNTAVPGITGAALFKGTELIGIVENIAGESLNLSGTNFSYDTSPIFTIQGDGSELQKNPVLPTAGGTGSFTTVPIPKPVISIASGSNGKEGTTPGTFTLTRTGDTTQALTVSFDAPTGSATAGTDYQTPANQVTFATGSKTATVSIDVIDDTSYEGTEKITLNLVNGYTYNLSQTAGSATIDLLDNEAKPIIGTRRGETLAGGDDNDNIDGKGGHDRLSGGIGDDLLFGNRGQDTLIGGVGNDTLIGGFDRDILTGGAGADRFSFGETGTSICDLGPDRITDFSSKEGDLIVLNKSTFATLKSVMGSGFSLGSEFAVVTSDRDAYRAQAAIVYNQSSGSLFYNQNGANRGLGSDGGAIAIFDQKPTLTAGDFIIG